MMPISVRDNSTAIQMGANRANNAVAQFNQGLRDAGKGFEQGMIISRLKEEEDEYMKRQRLQKALDANDTEAIRKLLQDPWYQKLWSAVKGEGWKSQIDKDLNKIDEENRAVLNEYHSKKNEGYNPAQTSSVVDKRNVQFTAMPNTIEQTEPMVFDDHSRHDLASYSKEQPIAISPMPETIAPPVLQDRNEHLRKQAQTVVNDVPDTTVARAAETAGINTGYIPASQQDKGNIEEVTRNRNEIVSNYKNAISQGRMLLNAAAQFLIAGGDEGQALAAQNQAEARKFFVQASLLREQGIAAGVNKDYFVDGLETGDGTGIAKPDELRNSDELRNYGSKLKEMAGDKLPDNVMLQSLSAQLAKDNPNFKPLNEKEFEYVLDFAKKDYTDKRSDTQAKQDIAKGTEDVKDREFNRKIDDWNRDNKANLDHWQKVNRDLKGAYNTAADYYAKGMYRNAMEAMKAANEDANKMKVSLFNVGFTFNSNPSPKEVYDALLVMRNGIKGSSDEITKLKETMPKR